jgi:hypothetical protein
MNVYLITRGNKIYSARLKVKEKHRYKTCLIGLTDRTEAIKLRNYVNAIDNEVGVVQEIDAEDKHFATALRLNNLAIMVAHSVNIKEDGLNFEGNILDHEHEVADVHRLYFDVIYENSGVDD